MSTANQNKLVYLFLYDKGSGHYLYIEASSPRKKGDFADLLSPPLYTPRNVDSVQVNIVFCYLKSLDYHNALLRHNLCLGNQNYFKSFHKINSS